MTDFRPDPRLCGLPLAVFECFGKPHFMAHYSGSSINSHVLDDYALCLCCGKVANNAHHWPIGRKTVEVAGKVLRPSLFAVCGSGTTGCHNGWHGGARYRALWHWDDERYFSDWCDGKFWRMGYEPHDQRLYLFGYWEIFDLKDGRIWKLRRT